MSEDGIQFLISIILIVAGLRNLFFPQSLTGKKRHFPTLDKLTGADKIYNSKHGDDIVRFFGAILMFVGFPVFLYSLIKLLSN